MLTFSFFQKKKKILFSRCINFYDTFKFNCSAGYSFVQKKKSFNTSVTFMHNSCEYTLATLETKKIFLCYIPKSFLSVELKSSYSDVKFCTLLHAFFSLLRLFYSAVSNFYPLFHVNLQRYLF